VDNVCAPLLLLKRRADASSGIGQLYSFLLGTGLMHKPASVAGRQAVARLPRLR
jgi:hypothetical protein